MSKVSRAHARVSIVQRSLRRYREPFYQRLRGELQARGVRLRLLHSTAPEREHRGDPGSVPWSEYVRARYVSVRGNELVWQPCLRLSRSEDLVILEQASVLMVNYAILLGQRAGGARVAFWGHGENFNPAARSSTGEAVKRLVSRQAHWWFPYTEQGARIVERLGFPAERISVVRNATDTRRLVEDSESVTTEDVDAVRAELGLTGPHVGLFVGSWSPVKRLDFLFAAADHIRSAIPDFELVVAGGGMHRPIVTEAARQRPWIRVTGHRFGRDLATLLATGKVLLVPAGVGLIAADSLAAGVPLVASASFPHGPEVAYIEDGRNGRVVDDRAEPGRYAEAVAKLLVDDEQRSGLVRGCLEGRTAYSVEDMAARFAAGIERALDWRA